MRKAYLYLALICLPLCAQAGDLTLIIAVSGADSAALQTISTNGVVSSIHATYPLTNPHAVLASVLTGVSPSVHGICADSIFDRDQRHPVNLFLSDRPLGIATPVSYDCDPLLYPTLTDQLRLRHGADPRIYAIGQDPATTLILAGKGANACCWLERRNQGHSGLWASTSYYREGLPSTADRLNINGSLDHLSRDGGDAAVFALATALQKDKKLGLRTDHDALLVHFTSTASVWGLIETCTRQVGKDHLHVLVIGLPAPVDNNRLNLLSKWNLQSKSFSLDRAVALTSSYLMALYGYERWLDGGYGNSIYLNHPLIESKGLSLSTIRQQVAEFLMEFDGVSYACPIDQAYLQSPLRESIHKHFVGDVIFLLQANYQPQTTIPATLQINY